MDLLPKSRLIIDGDIPVFQYAAAHQEEVEWEADVWSISTDVELAMRDLVAWTDSLIEVSGVKDVAFCFSDTKNFRKDLLPSYKENRKNRKPVGYKALKEKVMEKYPSFLFEGVEGDDAMGIVHTPADLMVSIDKDLLTVPGMHMHPDTHEVVQVGVFEARYFHMMQTLTGDTTDNYKGCPTIGPVKAARLLTGHTMQDMWRVTVETFVSKGLGVDEALCQARMAYILRGPEDYDLATNTPRLWMPTF